MPKRSVITPIRRSHWLATANSGDTPFGTCSSPTMIQFQIFPSVSSAAFSNGLCCRGGGGVRVVREGGAGRPASADRSLEASRWAAVVSLAFSKGRVGGCRGRSAEISLIGRGTGSGGGVQRDRSSMSAGASGTAAGNCPKASSRFENLWKAAFCSFSSRHTASTARNGARAQQSTRMPPKNTKSSMPTSPHRDAHDTVTVEEGDALDGMSRGPFFRSRRAPPQPKSPAAPAGPRPGCYA